MFTLVALLCFVLALFDVAIGDVNLVILGLAFFALHLMWSVPVLPWRPRE